MKRIILIAALAGLACSSLSFAGEVQIKPAKEHVDFLVDGELVGRYLISADRPKPIFWPLKAPGGAIVTRAWPMEKAADGGTTDHPHQQSAWFCHGDVIPEGLNVAAKIKGIKGVDFWSVAPGHGKIICTKVATPVASKDQGHLTTHNEWRTADDVKILDETRKVHFYDLGKARLLVFDIDLHASVVPIVFGDTKEGAMGVRVNDVMREKLGGLISNGDGKRGSKECWGQHSNWCDYSGVIDGMKAGIAILSDPKNIERSAYHVRDYGLMAANPFGRAHAQFPAVKGKTDLVRLEKGAHLPLRYGILVHTGDAESGQVQACYEQFVKLRENEK